MTPEISIVMTAWNRAALLERTLRSLNMHAGIEVIVVEDGNEGGATRLAIDEFSIRNGNAFYLNLPRPSIPYRNPAKPINVGIKAARGEYVILQNAECEHAAPDVIERLIEPIRCDPNVATFAQVQALGPNRQPGPWYCHKQYSPRPYFFCGALRRDWFLRLGGMEESFEGYGWEDDYFAFCMQVHGIRFEFTDAPVWHQWHPSTGCPGLESNRARFDELVRRITMSEIPPVANPGREWGVLEKSSS